MNEIYRKQGTVVRWDNGLTVRVDESGEAIEEGSEFRCHPAEPLADLPAIEGKEIEATARAIHARARDGVVVERLIVSEGHARHSIAERTWTEDARRIHLSLVNPQRDLRAILDTASFDVDHITRVVDALSRASADRDPGKRLRLAGNVTAALLPSMLRQHPPGVEFFQSPLGVDGRGAPVLDLELTGEPWPNWYRPTYRVRPMRAPHHIRAQSDDRGIDPDLPQAIALLAPPIGRQLRLLCVDAKSAFPATVAINVVVAAGEPGDWYPYGAGAFAAEMVVETATIA